MKRLPRYFCAFSIVASLGLAVYLVTRVGLTSILDRFRLLGWGFITLFLLTGARQFIRSVAWQICLNREDHHPSLLQLFGLRIIGNAVTHATPVGPLFGEGVKVWVCSEYMHLKESAAFVAVEDLIYGLGTTLFISGAVVLFLLHFVETERFQFLVGAVAAVPVLLFIGLGFVVSRQKLWLTAVFNRLTCRLSRRFLIKTFDKDIREFERNIHQFFCTRKKAFLVVLVLELMALLSGIGEVYLILVVTAGHASILTTYLVEAANRLVHLAFFMPMGLGTEEGTAGAMLKVLGYGLTEGVSLAIIRKGGTIFWDALGLVLGVRWCISSSGSPVKATHSYANYEVINCQGG